MTGLFSHVFLPFARRYARHRIGDRPADPFYAALCAIYFYRAQGYWPRLRNPLTFSELTWHKMLYDRNPMLGILADKLAVREYVTRIADGRYLVDVLWSGTNPDAIPFDSLPPRFVIKTTHSSGWNIIVNDRNALSREAVRGQLKQWLARNYCYALGTGSEWCYSHIEPRLMVEEFIGSSDGRVPVDFKFECFQGRPYFVQVDFDRFGKHCRAYCDADFNRLDFTWEERNHRPVPLPRDGLKKPCNADEMLNLAAALSRGFDHLRVDLYSVEGRVRFGELTHYDGGGLSRFRPATYDALFGAEWRAAAG